MSQTVSKSSEQAGKAALNEVKHKAASPLIQRLERFGYVIRGVIYSVIGLLALELAIGAGGAATSPSSAIALIGKQPFGKVLLVLVAIGLLGYSIWGFVRAIFDPLHRGSDTKGLIARAGFLFSGVTYGLLLIPTVLTLLNKPGASSQSGASPIPAGLMSGPLGKWLVIGFGIFWIVAGAGQLATAYSAEFMRDLKTGLMNVQQFQMVTNLGKAGYAARGIVFALIGGLILQTGSPQSKGIDNALATLAHLPYGEILLALVATGLILFGVYSAFCAKYIQTGPRRATS